MSRELLPLDQLDEKREQRLDDLRDEAQRHGTVPTPGIRPVGAPFPQASPETGYYGIPLLKPPAWTWEVPLYFFVGGAAGAAAVIGAVADYSGANRKLVRDARWIAATGSVLSPVLLITDLGRPSRFLSMLRVFKPQSVMSVGVWALVAFCTAASATAFAEFIRSRYGSSLPVRILENAGQAASLALGLPFSNYTGVLIGATVIPAWNENAGNLPVHFAASGVGAAVGLLELMGNHKSRALQTLGMGAALLECCEGLHLERRTQSSLKPIKQGRSGWAVRAGGILSGPVPALLRLVSMVSRERGQACRKWASVSSILGSLITRAAWIHVGRASARDWREPLQLNAVSDGSSRYPSRK